MESERCVPQLIITSDIVIGVSRHLIVILHSGSAVSHFRESQYKHNGCYLLGEGRRGRGDLGDSVPKGRGESEWDG